MIQHQAELEAIIQSYQIPSEKKLLKRVKRLDQMKRFYESRLEKEPEMPDKQKMMFNGFIESIDYSIAIIKMHRKLTQKLAGIAGGAVDIS